MTNGAAGEQRLGRRDGVGGDAAVAAEAHPLAGQPVPGGREPGCAAMPDHVRPQGVHHVDDDQPRRLPRRDDRGSRGAPVGSGVAGLSGGPGAPASPRRPQRPAGPRRGRAGGPAPARRPPHRQGDLRGRCPADQTNRWTGRSGSRSTISSKLCPGCGERGGIEGAHQGLAPRDVADEVHQRVAGSAATSASGRPTFPAGRTGWMPAPSTPRESIRRAPSRSAPAPAAGRPAAAPRADRSAGRPRDRARRPAPGRCGPGPLRAGRSSAP